MSQRPAISPAVLAAIIGAAPERLQKKLDREPRVADDWEWEHSEGLWTISAGEEKVNIPSGTITEVVQVKCSCLLSPRCFHVLAVLNVAEITLADDEDVDHHAQGEADLTGSPESGNGLSAGESEGVDKLLHSPERDLFATTSLKLPTIELTPSQMAAAHQMFDACAGILTTGLRASGAVMQSRLLRAIHECRSEGLHRIAAGGLRLMTNLRLLREGDDQFSSAIAENDYRDVLEACVRLTRYTSKTTTEWLGIARRAYEPINSLKLHGLFCEPILTRSGYGGVVTWMIADDGWIGSVSDVQPGDAGRIDQAWRSGISLAGLSLSHRDLSRKCLLISKGTRSVDGRLGGGESARAVTIDGQGWNSAPIIHRFKTPLFEQIRRAFDFQAIPEFLKPAGTDLVFFEATVLGFADQDLIVRDIATEAVLKLAILIDDDKVAFRGSLKMLARAPGLSFRCVGRVDLNVAGRISLLAISPGNAVDEQQPRLIVAEKAPVLSIGLEEISRSQLSSAQSHPVPLPDAIVDNRAQSASSRDFDSSLERWLRAIMVGGRHAIPQGLVTTAARDAARLKNHLRPTAASLLYALTQSTIATSTDMKGIRFSEDPAILAEKWLAASLGCQMTTTFVQMHEWKKILT